MSKTTKKLMRMTTLENLQEMLNPDNHNVGDVLMRRRRDGGASLKNNPWEETPEEEGINTSVYVYELQNGPQIRPIDGKVMTYSLDGDELDERSIEHAKAVCLVAHKYKGKRQRDALVLSDGVDYGEVKKFATEEEYKTILDGNGGYDIFINPDGEVVYGCQHFSWEEIDKFGKKMGWWK